MNRHYGHVPVIFELTTRHCRRRGQALVEFAVVAIVLYLLLAAILTFGMLLYGAQTLQQAAHFAARELARTPLPAEMGFEQALQHDRVRQHVYSEDFLAIEIDPEEMNENETILDYVDRLGIPPVNRMLLPLMFVDTVENGAKMLLRYPGALLTCSDAPSGYTVRIPIVRYASSQDDVAGPDEAIVSWRRVLEGRRRQPSEDLPDAFSVASPERGLVVLQLHYPYQSAVMSGFRRRQDLSAPHPDDPLLPIRADDNLPGAPLPEEGTLTAPDVPGASDDWDAPIAGHPYSGPYGLGRQAAWGTEVRPFRRVLSAQAVARREVFD